MSQTIVEKIFSISAKKRVEAGDIEAIDIDYAMAHDGTAPLAIEVFKNFGADKVWDNKKIFLFIDHIAPSASEAVSKLHKNMRIFANTQGIKLYDVGCGVCHQLMVEEGYAKPGDIIVGADSHTCMYGALGCFSTGLGSTDIAAVFLNGKLWFKIPETIKINLTGKLQKGIDPKDVILYLIGKIKADGATYKSIEFSGPLIKEINVDGRLTLCNMVVEMGAKDGIIEPDKKTLEFSGKGKVNPEDLKADKDARYSSILDFDMSSLEPQISCPSSVDNVKPISEVEGIEINQVFLGSCTNGRLSDLSIAARILDEKRINKNVRMIVTPSSKEIYLTALKSGLIEKFIKAGCAVCNPGCGPCPGGHQGILAPDEICLSTSNRNFIGRMGCADADIYLASPATVAASAIEGKIVDPRSFLK